MENGEESGLASCNWTGKLQLLFEARFRIRNFSTSAEGTLTLRDFGRTFTMIQNLLLASLLS
jgi:hypothetical protein